MEELGGKIGDLQKIISIVDRNNTVLLSMLSLHRAEKKDWMIVLRLRTKNADPIVKEFEKEGFSVACVA